MTRAGNEASALARAKTIEQLVRSGANPDGIVVVDVEDLPIAYLSGNTLRPRVRVFGDIAKA